MRAFELYDATTIKEAVDLLRANSTKTARVVGGGSDLVGGLMKAWVHGKGLALPDVLVDITTVKDMVGISDSGGGLTIGAATTLSDVIDHKLVQDKFGLLSSAALSVASPLIRNFGTLGGNINQPPRCWVFRGEDFACYKKGGDFCYAVTGDNRYHAIIGGELCYIVHPSDTATALLALNAQAKVVGPGGERTVPFDQYFHGPREDVLTENVLKSNEVMTEVIIPTPAAGTKMAWTKLKDRQVYDFAVVAGAAVYTLDGTSSVRPSWSPDGTHIAYQTSQDNAYRVYVMAADGTDRRLVSQGAVDDRHPTWSPDGKMLAVDTGTDLKRDLALIDLGTG